MSWANLSDHTLSCLCCTTRLMKYLMCSGVTDLLFSLLLFNSFFSTRLFRFSAGLSAPLCSSLQSLLLCLFYSLFLHPLCCVFPLLSFLISLVLSLHFTGAVGCCAMKWLYDLSINRKLQDIYTPFPAMELQYDLPTYVFLRNCWFESFAECCNPTKADFPTYWHIVF